MEEVLLVSNCISEFHFICFQFFRNGGGNEKTAVTGDSHEDDKPPPGNQSPNDKSRESVFSGNSRSKSLIVRHLPEKVNYNL